ncbi:protein DEK-like [Lytechinus variegatus]|uniref:protein DEK-like n=1 Tax=Lytechinus variegatus TaxID=7654 RepID=UPI001BB1E59F|nr:protein DEK-like [Lytechinus variegatus]
MSSDEKANGVTMANEQKDEEMKTNTAEEDEKKDAQDQKDEQDVEGDKEEEDEEESSSEEELPLGSVEAPVQIMTGKRDRKKVERLVMKETPKTPEKQFVVPVGKGVKLADIPIVHHFIEKTKAQDLKPLHKFLFGRFVRDHRETKKNIRLFSGFDFTKEDNEYAKREAILCKFTMEGIKELCTILDVEKKGLKDVIMERLMDFCMNPQPSGRPVPQKGKRGKPKGTKKTKSKKPKGKGKKGGGDASTGAEEDGDTTIDDGTEGDAEGDGGDTSMTEGESKPKKKKPKTPKPKKAEAKPKSPKKKKNATKTPSKQTKKSSPVKSPKKTPKKRKHEDVGGNSSDDEPLMKKANAPPTDKQIKETVKTILEGANLEEVTMKMVCRKVYDTYPQHPLQHKKDFIKSTVREIIS